MTQSAASKVATFIEFLFPSILKLDISGRYHHEERMMSDLRSRNSRYEETQITGRDAKNQLDDQVIATKSILDLEHLSKG